MSHRPVLFKVCHSLYPPKWVKVPCVCRHRANEVKVISPQTCSWSEQWMLCCCSCESSLVRVFQWIRSSVESHSVGPAVKHLWGSGMMMVLSLLYQGSSEPYHVVPAYHRCSYQQRLYSWLNPGVMARVILCWNPLACSALRQICCLNICWSSVGCHVRAAKTPKGGLQETFLARSLKRQDCFL